MNYTTLKIELDGPVARLILNRPDKANAMSEPMWAELPQAAAWLNAQPQVRVVILTGAGRHFTAGIDLEVLHSLSAKVLKPGCPARARESLRDWILWAQNSLTAIENIRVPVIAEIQGACVGGGVDLASACDLRYSTVDAKFCIKEVDLAVVADVGTLQRLAPIIGHGRLTELTYTGETFTGAKAEKIGLVSEAFATAEALHAHVDALARSLAAKSPLTLRGIKKNLLYSRDHTVAEGLEYAAGWNAAMLVSDDLAEAVGAFLQKRAPTFAD
ncbi:crotonase/enoyl-CoA hydratase family protein [Nevskia sp.]|uniref:crotonase/enoyl-CoA hydratase family protein n=1 Tax=Nevskia sp. TaxID=1929292 RepID=UPI0025E11AEC|nr:crotonase/enoyl-CoA hydratase family protein [Nevskia sp.]